MVIGIDFDNTIIAWDALFYEAATQKKLVPQSTPVSKEKVRDYLREADKEDAWTELQGCVYGSLIKKAKIFPGVHNFLVKCKKYAIPVYIISHKTRYPFLGERYDLQQAANDWLEGQGFYEPEGIGLKRSQVFFELTKEEKLNRIAQMGCTYFVDDLPEFLLDKFFPSRVQKILFDPNDQHDDDARFHRLKSWKEIEERLFAIHLPTRSTQEEELHKVTASLLADVGEKRDFVLEPILGGANNKVFRVNLNHQKFLLKVYFQHPDDFRDRLRTEFTFSKFAWNHGIQNVPRPISSSTDVGAALYEYVDGRRLCTSDITENAIRQAKRFYEELNRYKHTPEAHAIQDASEACFTIQDHLACVEKKVLFLCNINSNSQVDQDASSFVHEQLYKAWVDVKSFVFSCSQALAFNVDKVLAQESRCISPSDFGFHNALVNREGNLWFIDFEYAGWCDPAKLISDFFCQPALPVPLKYFEEFSNAVSAQSPEPEHVLARTRLLFPVYKIKWCCILLNEFVPTGSARRNFAGGGSDEDQKRGQLAKAHAYLKDLSELKLWLV